MTELDPVSVLDAARATVPFLPSATPLEVSAFETGDPLPPPDTQGVFVSLVGSQSFELVLVASTLVQEALDGAEGLTIAEALRPALEAAAGQLGTGVLDATEEREVGTTLSEDNWHLATLTTGGKIEGWFGARAVGTTAEQPPATAPDSKENGKPQQLTEEQRAESMRLLYDVEMTLTTEIGRTKLSVHDVLDLTPGAVIELDRSAGSPADVLVNGRLIARGEIVVVDEEYGIRITEIVSPQDQNQ